MGPSFLCTFLSIIVAISAIASNGLYAKISFEKHQHTQKPHQKEEDISVGLSPDSPVKE